MIFVSSIPCIPADSDVVQAVEELRPEVALHLLVEHILHLLVAGLLVAPACSAGAWRRAGVPAST